MTKKAGWQWWAGDNFRPVHFDDVVAWAAAGNKESA